MTTDAPLFTVLKGKPSDTELAALSAVLTRLSLVTSDPGAERNLWGRREMPHRDTIFNPNAFRNVSFY